jgi:transcriptional regulator with XRE-family HTH domain
MSFNLEEILKRKKLDKTELANRLGVSRQTIYGYLKNPSLKTLTEIADALEVELFELFEMSDFKPIYEKDELGTERIVGYLKK